MIETKTEPIVVETSEISAKASDSRRKDMRVAVLSPTLVRGPYWQPIFRELTREIPNTVIFTGDWPGFLPGYEDQFKVQHVGGYRYLVSETTSTGADIGMIWASPSVLRKLMQFRADVIFAASFNVWTLYALLYKALSGCRVIIGWEGNAPTTTYLDRPMRLKIRRMMSHFIDAAYTNTHEGFEYLRTVIGMPTSKIWQHPFQVPEASALRLCSEGSPLKYDRRPVFLFVASIIKRKGWRYLIDAAIRLKQEMGPCFSVVLVGPGSELDELRDMVSKNNLGDIVYVEGPVPYDALGRYFRACDVFVLPTLEDTWGMVVLEAMVFGKAILCSKYAGSREMVKHGVNGFVFDPCQADELYSYMRCLIDQPELVTACGARAAEMIAPYTPKRTAAIFADLAEAVVTPSRRGAQSNRPDDRSLGTVERPRASAMLRADPPPKPARTENFRIVTTSWDDGDRADLRLAEMLRSRGVPGTFYVPITPYRNETLTHSDLRLLRGAGFEIGAHGYSHKLLWNLSAAELAAEIEPCKPALEDIVGEEVRMFCYPQGRYDGNTIRALKQAGYSSARTVRMLATGLNFDLFEMPTSVQAFPHPRYDYFKNVIRGRKLSQMKTCLVHTKRLSNWVGLGKSLFDSVLKNGGVWHLYGHSWELDELNLWKDLEQLLDYVCKHEGVTYVPNGEVAHLLRGGKQTFRGMKQS